MELMESDRGEHSKVNRGLHALPHQITGCLDYDLKGVTLVV
jgi:hypothetical protein